MRRRIKTRNKTTLGASDTVTVRYGTARHGTACSSMAWNSIAHGSYEVLMKEVAHLDEQVR